ncbi:LysE/ArgO family amino acid transporter [Janibacter hoylei]|uniref:LysE/ArgO family amino acid transporter n=1 Tax=Janibacter hoylei TaxID=364298 RepID=UPI0021A5E04A|nr:LysE/ArgO family amino acid transporter [Janibacter hoylei]MCT1618910.1 LysE/ArgO family amino acid transporter [Janibacter hoylei]MCT2292328.1 LysE/ArgO family amino acid transporter [Janibacter hoylei]
MLTTALAGLLTGLTLIVAIGAQNAFVLRQGIRREHLLPVVAICIAADATLIALGTGGVGALVSSHPGLVRVVTWVGAAYLVGYGLLALRRATRPTGLEATAPASRGSVVATTLAITFLNPHVYLDTVLMLGSIANGFEDERWAFAGGAVVGSTVWFTGLALGARALARPLASPRTWRVLDAVIGVTMIGLGVLLAL